MQTLHGEDAGVCVVFDTVLESTDNIVSIPFDELGDQRTELHLWIMCVEI